MSAGFKLCRKNLNLLALLGTRIYGTFYNDTSKIGRIILSNIKFILSHLTFGSRSIII